MTSGRRPIRRHHCLMAAVPLMGCISLLACSEPTRQRVLEFFFDGVPKPGEEKKPPGYAPMGRAPSGPIEEAAAERARAERLMVIHAPYRDNQCNTCHNINTGLLFKTTQQGLCQTCHADVPGTEPFVHGPVAVNECLFCHHPHGSAYPHLLLEEPTPLCLRCHRQEDLGPAPYHSVLSTQSCSECHDAHGGNDRFFLKAGVPLAPEPPPFAPPAEEATTQPASQPSAEPEPTSASDDEAGQVSDRSRGAAPIRTPRGSGGAELVRGSNGLFARASHDRPAAAPRPPRNGPGLPSGVGMTPPLVSPDDADREDP